MLGQIKKFLIGKPLDNAEIQGEKYGILWGLPILSSDAISSVAYAIQEMLIVMIPIAGVLAFGQLTLLSGAIILLLAILTFSYRQTIQNYPNGGGAYIVAKDNLGPVAGVTAGAALAVDYVMTVAVSVSSGVEQIASAIQVIKPYTVPICVALVILLMIGNLRGIRESSRLFGVPAYAFIFALASLIITGFIKLKTGMITPDANTGLLSMGQPITVFLLLKAFASGCTALTGVEAVSNAVPNFKPPSPKHAKTVLVLLSVIILFLFGGMSILASMMKVVPGDNALIVLIAQKVFGVGFMYYFVTAATFIILIMASSTAYADFPMLLSVMSREGYAPRQLSMRGDRLSFNNGIVLLSAIAIILIVAFQAKVTLLISLYAIGVFVSFTLSQGGMLVRWFKHKGRHWQAKAMINGLGALVTLITVVIIASEKFLSGAWLVIIVVPLLMYLMLRIKRHYLAIAKELKIQPEEYAHINVDHDIYNNRVIVPMPDINKYSVRALRYAKTISDSVTAFCVVIDEADGEETKEKYAKLNTDIPLVIKYSPYRKIIEPLLEYIETAEKTFYKKGDTFTIVLGQFVVRKWWHHILHNNTRFFIEKELLKHKHIVVSIMPLQLHDDK